MTTKKAAKKKTTKTAKTTTQKATTNGTNGKASAPTNEKAARKPSALESAVRVLGETKEPMTTTEMIEAMATKGYWTSPGGKTPANTLYAAILRELQLKGNDARFVKVERGKFALAGAKVGGKTAAKKTTAKQQKTDNDQPANKE